MINILYDLLYMLPMCLIALIMGGNHIGMPETGFLLLLFTVILCFIVSLFVNTKNKFKYLFLGLIVIILSGLILSKSSERRVEFILETLWIIELAGMSIAFEIIGRLAGRFKWVRRGIAILLIIGLGILLVRKIEINKAVVALAFLQLMIIMLDEIQISWKKEGDTEHHKHLVMLAPFLFVTAFLVFKTPVREKPYDWKLFVTVWEKTVEATKSITRFLPGGGDDGYAEVDFSDKSSMHGIISHYPKELMEITIPGGSGKVVYLSGKSFDVFNGREWETINADEQKSQLIDLVETETAIRKYDSEHYTDYIKSATISVKYLRFNTKFLFAPLKTVVTAGLLDGIRCVEYQDALRSNRRVGYGTSYSVKYDRMNSSQEKFHMMILSCNELDEKAWNYGLKAITRNATDGAAYEDYLNYKDKIKNDYTEEIVLSPELIKKLNEVCEGATDDWERLKKIEAWLGTFAYSETPGKLPEKVDSATTFLDYLLLESKTGYCVHYATAFALLARAEGYPSRLVQGLYVRRTGGTVVATSDMAHAWPEVYFDNFGWVSFEPTPSYAVDNSWVTSENIHIDKPAIANENLFVHEEDNETDIQAPEVVKKEVPVRLILFVFIICILFALIFLFSYYMLIKRRLKRMSNKDIYKLYCKRNIALINLLGYRMKNNETLSEYRVRLENENVFEKDTLDFIYCYEKLLYSDAKEDNNMLKEIDNSFLAIGDKLKLRKGIKRLIIKFRLSLIFASYIK